MAINEGGGPAFPNMVSRREWSNDEECYLTSVTTEGGMTLRDHFAGLAMQELIRAHHQHPHLQEGRVSWDAYRYADAMLKARESK